jgi:imidazolonepropionase-like amidohydrolase
MRILLLVYFFINLSGVFVSAARTTAFIHGVAHIGNGKVINDCLISIRDQKIGIVTEFNASFQRSAYDTVIDLKGMHVYPGLINANNVLGLHDAQAVRATVDFAEVGQVNPHIRALIAYNTDNLIIPTIRTNGILYTQVTPRGGLISGSSSVMALEGWNWEDAVLKADDGIHLNFPKILRRRQVNEEEQRTVPADSSGYEKDMRELDRFFSGARAYCDETVHKEVNLRFEAMRPVFSGKAKLYLHADKARDILAAIVFSEQHGIPSAVLVGAMDSYKVTAAIRKSKIPVMLGRIISLPDNADDEVDITFRTPFLLQKDSILFCLQLEGDMEAAQSRNLAFHAGTAEAYGLDREQALSSVTLNAAKILGIDKLCGSLEPGKLASLVVSRGNILDMRTNDIRMAYIAGKAINLSNRQTELYEKYKRKYGLEVKK